MAERCRRLARSCDNPAVAERLTALADEYARKAGETDAGEAEEMHRAKE